MNVPSIIRLNSTAPAAPAGHQNVVPQSDGGFPVANVSFYIPNATVGTPVEEEIVSFSGTSGTLANTPSALAGYTQVKLYRNGIRLQSGAGNDYTWSGAAITLAVAAASGDVFIADYYK